MSEKEVLSQAEIEALVKSDASGVNPDAIETMDFTKQKRILRGQFPVLEHIHERFSNNFSESLSNLLSKEVEISPSELKLEKFSEFMASLKNPSAINFYRFSPLRGRAMVIFDSDLVNTFVEKYFGGGQFKTILDEREFTNTELRIVTLVLTELQRDITSAWQSTLEINLNYINIETNPQLVNRSPAEDVAIVATFECKFAKELGKFHIAMPYSMLEPIRDQLSACGSHTDDDVDLNWLKLLKNSVMNVPIMVRSTLVKKQLSLRQISEFHQGDVIPIEMPEYVTLDVAGVPGFIASFGKSNNKLALKIESKIKR